MKGYCILPRILGLEPHDPKVYCQTNDTSYEGGGSSPSEEIHLVYFTAPGDGAGGYALCFCFRLVFFSSFFFFFFFFFFEI